MEGARFLSLPLLSLTLAHRVTWSRHMDIVLLLGTLSFERVDASSLSRAASLDQNSTASCTAN